jgi:site-specific recombinase XerC
VDFRRGPLGPHFDAFAAVLKSQVRHLNQECHLAKVHRTCVHVGQVLVALGQNARRPQFKTLGPEQVERFIQEHLKDSPENVVRLAAALRRFLCYCAIHRHTGADYSGLIPAVRQYRHAALPKGIEISALQRALSAIDTETPIGARDYAIFLLMMAYGIVF